MRASVLAATALALSFAVPGNSARAAECHPRVRIILSNAIDAGVPAFNAGDHEACARIYRRALWNVVPLLEGQPDLRADVLSTLRRAEHRHSSTARAWMFRHAIDRALAGAG